MKNVLLVSMFCLWFISFSTAQNLIIKYDYIQETTEFYKEKKSGKMVRLKRPAVRENQNIKVEVNNYNNYIFSARTEVASKYIPETAGFNFLNILTPVFSGSASNILGNLYAPQEETVEEENDTGFGSGDDDPWGEDWWEDSLSFSTVPPSPPQNVARAAAYFREFESAYSQLYDIEKTLRNIEFAIYKLKTLKYNPYLEADSIKDQADKIASKILKVSKPEYSDFLDTYFQIKNDYELALASAENNGNFFIEANVDFSSSDESFDFGFTEKSASTLAIQPGQVPGMLKNIEGFSGYYEGFDLENSINELQDLYGSISNSHFRYNAGATSADDITYMSVNFYKNPGLSQTRLNDDGFGFIVNSGDSTEFVKNKTFRIPVKGGFKINSSVGLAFPSFFNNSLEFFNKDSVVTAAESDNFIPNLAAFINFYPYTGRNINLGGTMGIGIPLNNTNFSVNFMFGLAAVLGKRDKVVLSAGMASGPVTKLGEGLETGDLMENGFEDVPTKRSYELGFYAGISFTIASILQ